MGSGYRGVICAVPMVPPGDIPLYHSPGDPVRLLGDQGMAGPSMSSNLDVGGEEEGRIHLEVALDKPDSGFGFGCCC